MGASAASLHILIEKPPQTGLAGLRRRPPAPQAAIEKEYARLGWRRAPDGAGGRCVALSRHGRFLTLSDPGWQTTDHGALAELAASLSRTLRTAAIMTRLGEGGFSILLFHMGEQVDAVGSEPDEKWVSLRGRPQAALWRSVFGAAQLARLGASQDRLADPLAPFMTQAGAALQMRGATAEAALSAWCRLAGLPASAMLDAQAASSSRLYFQAAPGRPNAARKRALRFEAASADYPYHGFYPAAWPVAAGVAQSFAWRVICRGAGLDRFRLALHIDRTGGFLVQKISLSAYGFHHGQIASAAALAHFGLSLPGEIGRIEADFCFDEEGFGLPDPITPGGAYALVIRIDVIAPEFGEATLTPTLRAGGLRAPPLILPTLRLAVADIAWAPVVADPMTDSAPHRDAVLRLNAPAVHHCAALLADTGGDLRAALRVAMERLLEPMTFTALVASVHTEQHTSPSSATPGLAVARATRKVPLRTLLQDKSWPRLFDAASNYQTVQIGIALPDAPWPLAGITVQESLRNQQDAADDEVRVGGPTVAAAFWANAEDSALSLLQLDIKAARTAFAAFVRNAAPLQAWCADCTWIPVFDRYGAYTLTPYEAAAEVDWFGRGLAGTLTDRAWLGRRLRFVAPTLWLGWRMAELIDASKLTSFAQVSEIEDGLEIVLHNPRHLAQLEKALLPLLPINL